jgi:hypothetical protein
MIRPTEKWLKVRRADLALLLFTSLIYFSYFPQVFLSPNSILAGITGDALKNYYTFAYHAVKDEHLLHFSGMNFPFGEHIVYTDCQPLISSLLRLLPFSHNYVIGILHYLLFLSYIISPLILFRIFIHLHLEKRTGFFLALAIAVLSPQFQKINGGHHGLAYGCVIPLSILLCLRYDRKPTDKLLVTLIFYHFCLFFIHPYLGLAASIFSGLGLPLAALFKRVKSLRSYLTAVTTGAIPIAAFRLFMLATDKHAGRSTEPFGKTTLLENIDSLLAPDFGPFQPFMERLFPTKMPHLESHSYLGFALIVICVLSLPLFIWHFRKLKSDPGITAFFVISILLLLFSFGWIQTVLERMGLHSAGLNQFRAASRFAWSFYYLLPIFVFQLFARSLANFTLFSTRNLVFGCSLFYLALNLVEANDYFTKDKSSFWKYRNILSENHLLAGEIKAIQSIQSHTNQAIIALPIFHIGSETYSRAGGDASMIPAMFYSYHCHLPILGASLSRISVAETKSALQLINPYLQNTSIGNQINDKSFVIIKTLDELMPDEKRLIRNLEFSITNDSAKIGFMNRSELLAIHQQLNEQSLDTNTTKRLCNYIFLPTANRKPFVSSELKGFHNAFVLPPAQLPTGRYVICYHYISETAVEGHAPNLIIARRDEQGYRWEQQFNGRIVSGFYDGLQVFEFVADLNMGAGYEFVLNGGTDERFHIQNFLIRPDTIDTKWQSRKELLINNFPLRISETKAHALN